MARPARPWFRFYVEAMRDPKMRRLTPAERWLWVAILAAARESCDPGSLMVADGVPMTTDDLADYAGMPMKDVGNGVTKMLELGMLCQRCNAETLSIPAWFDRQYESDNSAERVAKHRSNDAHSVDLVTPSSVSVSDSVSVSQKEQPDFEEFWMLYPRHVGKDAARKAFANALKRNSPVTIIQAVRRLRNDPNLPDMNFIPHASTWLNEGRWSDDPYPPRIVRAQSVSDRNRDLIIENVERLRAQEEHRRPMVDVELPAIGGGA